jgi:hypothetical protein
LLLSIPVQQDEQEISGDTPSEQSSGENMPTLFEPLANGAGNLPTSNPPAAHDLQSVTPLSTSSNETSNLLNPGAATHDTPDGEHPTNPSTHVDTISARESMVLEDFNAEDPVHYASDASTDVDSVPSIIAASEEPGHLFSFPGVGRNPQVAREENGETSGEPQHGEGEPFPYQTLHQS